MKTFHKLWPLLAVIFLAGAAGTGCTAKVKKAYHERQAEKFFTAGDWDRAELEYLNVLRNDQENTVAATRLGGIYFDQGRLQRAAYYLGKASVLATNDLDVRLKLGFISAAFGKSSEARAAAEFVLSRRPQDDQAPLLLAEMALRPKEVAAVRQALLTLARRSDRAAIEVALGNLAFREHDFTNAAAAFQRAQALDAKSPAVNSALGSLCWVQNDLKRAEIYFKAAADSPGALLAYRLQYARFQMKTGHMDEAQKILTEISAKSPGYVPAMMAAAEIAAQTKKYDESEALVAKVLARDEYNFEAMLFLGQVKQMRGDRPGALQTLNRMVRMFPQSPLAYYFLASANAGADDAANALANLSRALELQPEFTEATILQSRLLLQNGNAAPVIVTLEKLRQKQPENADAQLLLADAYRLQHRVEDALEIYRALEARFTNNAKLPMLLGAVYLQKQDAPAARAEFAKALQLEPDNLIALGELVDADIAQKKFADAQQRVQAELARRPQEIELHLLAAKVFIAQGEVPQAQEKLQQTAALFPKNPNANLLLAQLYFNAQENAKALAKLQAALVTSPKNIAAWMMCAAIHVANKDYTPAAAAYEKVLELDPQFSPAMNNLACLYSENLNQPDRAYALAQEGHKLLPFDPSVADTLGWISFKRGDYAGALGLLKQSVAKPEGANNPEIQCHFGMASYMMAEEAPAKTALSSALDKSKENEFPWREECRQALRLLEINPQTADAAAQQRLEKRLSEKAGDPVALTRLGRIYSRDGQVDKAIAAYQKMLAVFPSHLPTTVSLTRLYAAKDLPKAYEMAKDAYKIAPYDAEVQHLLGRLAYASKDFKLSASVLQEAGKQTSVDPRLFFDLAQANFAVGKIAEAQAALKKSLTLHPSPALATEIEQMLGLAESLASASPAVDSNKLADILKTSPEYLPALAVQAVAAERSGEAGNAAVSCEKILVHYPDFAPAQRSLALLYAHDPAKRDRAYDLAIQARNFYTDDLPLTKATGIILFAKGDYQRAAGLLKQCSARLEKDPEVFYYLGSAQFQNKDRAASKASLQRALGLNLSGKPAESARQMLAEMK